MCLRSKCFSLLQTALHLAAHTQQHELVRKLLVCDASLSLTDHKGNTPLHVVCRFSSSKCLEEILRLVKLSTILEAARIRNNEGLTCMHIAVQHKNTDALRKLKSIGVDINMQVRDKWSGSSRDAWGFSDVFTFLNIPLCKVLNGPITSRELLSYLRLLGQVNNTQ